MNETSQAKDASQLSLFNGEISSFRFISPCLPVMAYNLSIFDRFLWLLLSKLCFKYFVIALCYLTACSRIPLNVACFFMNRESKIIIYFQDPLFSKVPVIFSCYLALKENNAQKLKSCKYLIKYYIIQKSFLLKIIFFMF